ncbi:hypothetical protein JX265_007281 [Neoarthrinium moseri]|uniref:Allergen n=1 Tax=Neoarthrinium moseri TaxID=1658444 RepID=A0A9P9WK04_9PEZI|nr:hypothetical protein JX265_007281 [Neoarthrinium moseri]
MSSKLNKTKDTIRDFMGKSGHHDTTVDETLNPAVLHETVRPTQHEEVNTALDKEVHQDHYHHTVQPIHDREVLPEQHQHNVKNVQHREVDHRDNERTRNALSAEAAKFKDERVMKDTTRTQTHAPTVEGEHVHHHVHEVVQPVLHKETIQPNVVHTTVPIHETHHNEAQHHGTSTLPAMSADEYKRQGGTLGGNQTRHDAFEGCPDDRSGILSSGKHSQTEAMHQGSLRGVSGTEAQRGVSGTQSTTSRMQNQSGMGMADTRGANVTSMDKGVRHMRQDSGKGIEDSDIGDKLSTAASERTRNPSLLDKLNPMTDSTGDGKAGFMK